MPSDDEIERRLLSSNDNRTFIRNEYISSLQAAVDAGWSNVRIARVVNLSEAAIRMYRRRHGIEKSA